LKLSADAEFLRMRVVVGLTSPGETLISAAPLLDHNHLCSSNRAFMKILVCMALALQMRASCVGDPARSVEIGDVFIDLPLVDLVLYF
jgi:hypothetical protein